MSTIARTHAAAPRHTTPVRDAEPSQVPRYTSYPTTDRFSDAFGPHEAARALAARSVGPAGPLSVYVHLPYCSSRCRDCACDKLVTQCYECAPRYIEAVLAELALVDRFLAGDRRVAQIHLGGGSPTFLKSSELLQLMDGIRTTLDCDHSTETSIEVDPRFVGRADLDILAGCGFNRMSLRVQDFDETVQRAINRSQPPARVGAVLDGARALGFGSTNFDLICGLPHQTPQRFNRTVETVVALRPDRIALYHYAHMPAQFKAQRPLDAASLPSSWSKARMFDLAYEKLIEAGYVYIGMDHFALPEDKLAIAFETGCLCRSFQGYTTQPECDLLGLGASAISRIGPTYSQNCRDIAGHAERVGRGTLPTMRGLTLTRDDLARRAVIMAIMCHGYVDKRAVEAAHLLDFDRYFAQALRALSPHRDAGHVRLKPDCIDVTRKGRPRALQLIASAFDNHLAHAG